MTHYQQQNDSEFIVLLAAGLEGLASEEIWAALNVSVSLEKLKTYTFPSSASRKDLSVRYSCPEWLLKKWTQQFGSEATQKLLESIQNRPPFMIRTNTLKISRDALIERLAKQGLEVSKTESATGILFKERANLFDSDEFREGLFEVQDDGSQQICEKILPAQGELVWDVCAGAGGKTLALAAMMKDKGRIIATDIRQKKMEDLRKRAKRAGVSNIFPADLNRMDEIHVIRKGLDKIVVDAPCSGTGTLRRNPDAKWKLKESIFSEYPKQQTQIIEQSLPRLKPGGRLFYITCSLEPEENEEVVKGILQAHPELHLVPEPGSEKGFFQLRPDKNGTDGFFLAILEKTK